MRRHALNQSGSTLTSSQIASRVFTRV